MAVTAAQRMAIIQELANRGEDVSAFTANQGGGAASGIPGYDPQSKIAPADSAALKDLYKEVAQRRTLNQHAQEFMQAQNANNGTQTGMVYGMPVIGDVAKAAAQFTDPNQAIGQMDSVNNRAWQYIRSAGVGRILQAEIGNWRNAFPSTANPATVNQGIAQRMQSELQDSAARAAFADQFMHSGKGGFENAMAAFDQGQRAMQAGQGGQGGPTVGGQFGAPAAQPTGTPQQQQLQAAQQRAQGGAGGAPAGVVAPQAPRAPATPRDAAQTHFMQAYQNRAGNLNGAQAAWQKWSGDHFSADGSQFFPTGQAGKLQAAAQAQQAGPGPAAPAGGGGAPISVDIWGRPQ